MKKNDIYWKVFIHRWENIGFQGKHDDKLRVMLNNTEGVFHVD